MRCPGDSYRPRHICAQLEAGATAQSVMGWTCKLENPSLMLRTHIKMPGEVVHVYHPGAGEAETRGSRGLPASLSE